MAWVWGGALLKGDRGQMLVKVTCEFRRVVRRAMVIDSERWVTVSANRGQLRAVKGADEATVIFQYTHKLEAGMVLHRPFPEKVSGLVEEES